VSGLYGAGKTCVAPQAYNPTKILTLQAYASSSPGCRIDPIGLVPSQKGASIRGKKQQSPNQQGEERMSVLTDMYAGRAGYIGCEQV